MSMFGDARENEINEIRRKLLDDLYGDALENMPGLEAAKIIRLVENAIWKAVCVALRPISESEARDE